jgi:hypothetical protein
MLCGRCENGWKPMTRLGRRAVAICSESRFGFHDENSELQALLGIYLEQRRDFAKYRSVRELVVG